MRRSRWRPGRPGHLGLLLSLSLATARTAGNRGVRRPSRSTSNRSRREGMISSRPHLTGRWNGHLTRLSTRCRTWPSASNAAQLRRYASLSSAPLQMMDPIEFETERLLLRQWTPADREPFAALNADPRVMEFFPAQLTPAESDVLADRCESLIQERGWGFWVAELKASREFVGFVGLHTPSAELPFSPCVEIGWRLAFAHWGKGLAFEAARAALRIGFRSLGLNEIVSFTAVGNSRSRAVMERLNMYESGTFEHPHVPQTSSLRLHCLYRLPRTREDA